MKIEIRGKTEMRVSGYVNAVERDSRVLPSAMSQEAEGDFVEKVSAGAFRRAISRNPDIRLYFNHEREIGSISGGELKLSEDNIGLHAEAVVTDPEVIAAAKRGELRGWSFGFSGAHSSWENAGNNLRRRTLTDFELSEVSLLTKTPAYFGTSIECSETRGAAESDLKIHEFRSTEDTAENVIDQSENTSGYGRFFIAQKQLELLEMKGEM